MPGDPPLRRESLRNDPEIEAQYAAAPERVQAEILHGIVMMSPRTRTRHTFAASRLIALLGSRFDTNGTDSAGWFIGFQPELHLGPAPFADLEIELGTLWLG